MFASLSQRLRGQPATVAMSVTTPVTTNQSTRYALAAAILLAQLCNVVSVTMTVAACGLLTVALAFIVKSAPKRLLWKALLSIATIATGVLIYAQYRHLIGRDPGVALLFILGPLKLIEAKSTRDFMVVWCMGLILFVASFFDNLGLLGAITLPFIIIFYVATLRMIDGSGRSLTVRQHVRSAAMHTLLGLPLAALLFVLFPRATAPLWSMRDANTGRTGLSEEMQPGSISNLIRSNEIAFRVEFENDRVPRRNTLYWRGPVLRDFDGVTWRQGFGRNESREPFTSFSTAELAQEQIDYTITAERLDTHWLPMLEIPVRYPTGPAVERAMFATDAQQIGVRRFANGPTQYRAQSLARGSYPDERPPEGSSELRTGPLAWNPRTREFARQLAAQYPDPTTRIRALLNHFNQAQFFYTLNPPLYTGVNNENRARSIDDFLFEGRRGFCEHYASATAFLLRASGIPARVPTGYQGGEMQPGGYMVVRQSDAHAWVEAWVDGQWIRLDPTAAVAPNRIEQGLQSAVDASERALLGGSGLFSSFSMMNRLNYLWDDATFAYTKWIVGFDRDRQLELLNTLGLSWMRGAAAIGWMLLAVLASGLLIFAAWWGLQRFNTRHNDPALKAWATLKHRLRRAGLEISPHWTVNTSLRQAAQRWPQFAPAFEAFAQAYSAHRFSPNENEVAVRAAALELPSLSALRKAQRDRTVTSVT